MRSSRPFRPRRDGDAPPRAPRERESSRRPTFFRAPSGEGVRPSDEVAEGTVKWFNADKGFGFVELADGERSAFLHISVLETRRRPAPHAGAKLRGRLGEGPKGLQITEILELTDAPPAAEDERRFDRGGPDRGGSRPPRPAGKLGTPMLGTVKWFDAEKGFGFVDVEDGGGDVFLYIGVLQKTCMDHPSDGQRVMVLVVDGPRGREARVCAPVD